MVKGFGYKGTQGESPQSEILKASFGPAAGFRALGQKSAGGTPWIGYSGLGGGFSTASGPKALGGVLKPWS